MSDPAFWAPHFDGVNFARVPEADFEVGGRRYGVFAHEWRIDPPADWLMDDAHADALRRATRTRRRRLPQLGETEFLERGAGGAPRLHAAGSRWRPTRSSQRTCCKNERDPAARARALQQLLRQAAGTLETNPRDQKLFRVVRHTYLEPLATQELVAERLDLPFSTYRYQLGRAIARIAAWLWLRERAAATRLTANWQFLVFQVG